MRTHISRYAFLVALLAMLWATETMAATIGFGDLHGSNLSEFTSYTHHTTNNSADDFTVAATSGKWFEAHIFGNGVPAIGSGPVYNANADSGPLPTITVTGGTFIFEGVDLTSNSFGGTKYEIVGSLLGVEKFMFGTTISDINTFKSIGSLSADVVDKLTITGKRGVGVTSFNIDNIRVSAASVPGPPGGGCTGNCPDPNVPEPASLLLLGAGLAGIEIWRRRRGEG